MGKRYVSCHKIIFYKVGKGVEERDLTAAKKFLLNHVN